MPSISAERVDISVTLFALVLVVLTNSRLLAQASEAGNGAPRPETVICGPNAVYLLLAAYGYTVEPSFVDALVPSHPQGMSLLEVRNALRARGLDCEISEFSPVQFAQIHRPVILYCASAHWNGGHYLVATPVGGDSVQTIDPTTGRLFVSSLAKLPNTWGGIVILPKLTSRLFDVRKIILSILFTLVAVVVAKASFRQRSAFLSSRMDGSK